MKYQTKQTGSAIVVALFVVALVVMAATAMLIRIQQDMRRAELLFNSNQAYLYAQGSIAWAIDQLITDWKNQQAQHIIDKTPLYLPHQKMENFTIETRIEDAQGLFNLNNLTETDYSKNFASLIKTVEPDMNQKDIQNIVDATVSWISVGGTANTFDEYYSKQTPPYRSPHRLMASISELRLVKGMTSDLYTKLVPFIIALPAATPVNINNASAPVLMSLSPTLTPESAHAIETLRSQTPFETLQQFINVDIVKNNPFPENKITLFSTYFLVNTHVTVGDQSVTLYTLLRRDIKESQPTIVILWQSKEVL